MMKKNFVPKLLICLLVLIVIAALVVFLVVGGGNDPATTGPNHTTSAPAGTEPSLTDPTETTAPTEPTVPTEPTTAPTEPSTPTEPTIPTEPTEPPHEHSYTEEVVAPICIEAGYSVFTCDCGDTYRDNEVAATGHSWTEWEVTVEATTEAEGKRERNCSVCEAHEEAVIAKLEEGHTHSYTEQVVAPTCTEAGYSVFTCDCGDTYQGNEVQASGHSFTNFVSNDDATCLLDGTATAACDNGCGETTTTTDDGSAKGHNYSESVVGPTCSEKGYTVFTCTVCSDSYNGAEIAALGHSFTKYESNNDATCAVDGTKTANCDRCEETSTVTDEGSAKGHDYSESVVAPTCTEAGYTVFSCKVCGDSYNGAEVSALGHSFTDFKSNGDATCTADGTKTATCDRCAETETVSDTGSALGHSWTEWKVTVVATEAHEGKQVRSCRNCPAAEEEIIPKLDHTHAYTAKVVSPTCTEQGYTLYACNCGDSYKEDITNALGHSYAKKVTEATCTEGGYTTYTCSACGDSYAGDKVAAKGHSYGDWAVVTEATCTASGQEKRSCSRCDVSETQAIDARGHDYETVTVEAACTAAGSETKTCKVCADKTTTEIPALGHAYSEWTAVTESTCTTAGEEARSCTRCGVTETRTAESFGHDWTEWKTTKVATTTADGEKMRECKACGLTETEVIPMIEEGHKHTWVDSEAEATCTEDGYYQSVCITCGKTYKTVTDHAPGHDWSDWETTLEPTTSAAGKEQRTCAVCGEVQVIAIPALDENGEPYESYIDPDIKTEVTGHCVSYVYNDVSVSDFRTWGEAPSIWVNEDGSLTVVYYDQEGNRFEIIVEVPPEDHCRVLILQDDGSYHITLVGDFG